jgi:hypothetical protein
MENIKKIKVMDVLAFLLIATGIIWTVLLYAGHWGPSSDVKAVTIQEIPNDEMPKGPKDRI